MTSLRHTAEIAMHGPTSDRRGFGKVAISITAFVLSLGLLLSSGRADSNVTQVAGTQKGGASSDGKDAIRPFRVNVPKEQIVDLRRRIAATRWPDKETVNDESQGIQLAESSGSPASAYPEPSIHSPPKARWTAHCPVFLMLCC